MPLPSLEGMVEQMELFCLGCLLMMNNSLNPIKNPMRGRDMEVDEGLNELSLIFVLPYLE
jgi:hypothetical protein